MFKAGVLEQFLTKHCTYTHRHICIRTCLDQIWSCLMLCSWQACLNSFWSNITQFTPTAICIRTCHNLCYTSRVQDRRAWTVSDETLHTHRHLHKNLSWPDLVTSEVVFMTGVLEQFLIKHNTIYTHRYLHKNLPQPMLHQSCSRQACLNSFWSNITQFTPTAICIRTCHNLCYTSRVQGRRAWTISDQT